MCYKHLLERKDAETKVSAKRPATDMSGPTDGSRDRPAGAPEPTSKVMRHEDILASALTPSFLTGRIDSKSQPELLFPLPPIRRTVLIGESVKEKRGHLNNLQARASNHMKEIVKYLLQLNSSVTGKEAWESIIVSLIQNVVDNVDPNVKGGDRLENYSRGRYFGLRIYRRRGVPKERRP